MDAAVAEEREQDGTGGRGPNGKITKQLNDLEAGKNDEEPLQAAV